MTPNNPSPPSAAATDEAAFEAWLRGYLLQLGRDYAVHDKMVEDIMRHVKALARSSQRPSPSVGREEIAADKELGRLEKFADEAEVRARQGFGYAVPLAATPGFARRLRSVVQSVRDYRAAVERLTVAQGRAWDEGAAIGRQLERDALAQPATVAVEGEWVTVPREPTEAMKNAAQEAFPRSAAFVFPRLWSAMIAAAPKPTLPAGEWTDEQVEAAADAFLYEMASLDLKVLGWGCPVDWHRRAMRAALATITPTAGGRDA